MSSLDVSDRFARRHVGPSPDERDEMLQAVGAPTLDALMDEAIPASIRLKAPLSLPPAESEQQYLNRLGHLAHRNQVFRSYIGLGYYDTFTPSVILRMVLENPGWYTPYTPYQAEISQGRLESLLNFQTMVMDLTRMEVASASLLDEATAAGEAMALMHRARPGNRSDPAHSVCLVSDGCFPQTIDVLRSRAEPLGIDLRIMPLEQMTFEGPVFGAIVQYPDVGGAVHDLRALIDRAQAAGALVSVGADLLSLATARPPWRDGRRCRLRKRPEIWRAARIRWTARGVLRDAQRLRSTVARASDRRVRRYSWSARLPDGAGDARATHPPREGHLEHLHGAGAAGEYGGHVCRVSRAARDQGDRLTRSHG